MTRNRHARTGGADNQRRESGTASARQRRRTYSQNFLTDTAVARRVVRASGVGPGDDVVEPGAGAGMLTRYLAPACGRLTAYEIDPHLAETLRARFAPAVRVVRADFRRAQPPREPFHVVGNIPYSATAGIVRWCLEAAGVPAGSGTGGRPPALLSATLITQLEYARKRTGGFGRWSRLTVHTWPLIAWSSAGRVPRDRFRPVPGVDSAILRLVRRPWPLVGRGELDSYRELVDLGFSGVGGSLRASLLRAHPARRVDSALSAAGVARSALVADVSPDRWVLLHARLT
ncbi:ErmE/ErmH/ErmO/ErmR family 23S rRNA (adenine(2058)-N(6))-methyltransferase [Streptomonospora wellingtoniae]|uniref:ErmE/ErmH/ErmO/ErmR family 23S rRNA (Adenine(2058)-N(6))-methyltransferase n=1 Tax=Streptomonospora wellingtoniae TaxID=3075544 RepID=A0ABU2KTJ9_9ACTN|nr:ErmE/ErmH/ErmO/ErmR family 23S rRNA (adenine(2058)-N(6))-methyltransferase [Streptomonospora sp. DSM 45055]MDT0302615.1 ErmE/ErmH/ErmO/ErmR family 23S rRNA (adenine(2058)-N(6))-methyltransferase [Streptomonospora sp. DSM 45055]